MVKQENIVKKEGGTDTREKEEGRGGKILIRGGLHVKR